ncbi:MAG TPA: CDF family Co(II)/Ni(II) efflux transporter DmeF [Steroidobacteraceae bacterium]|jgi:cation diffusion facilitator family transporter|nr:CDF family Co(II)/Ni(II) efflux transporter DmeF [Steroidobacteraceae bacterium]HNS26579.1 CDF family Co(II)/Ni(II) efflux transporter DmeF [Steroidobacteraceae bacterium]
MHVHRTEHLGHDHVYLGDDHERNERRTWWVIGLTLVMMVGEVVAGMLFGSMALLADGWHMATHAGALSITALAYAYARRHARNARFTFGTGKVGDLAGFASALILAVIALLIAVESLQRFLAPVPIAFTEATAVAALGLAVNLVSALLLRGGHSHAGNGRRGHDHDHDHEHGHTASGADLNLRAAYLHVIADALTSVAAILALVLGRWLGWVWLDPVIGVAGAVLIGRWSLGLMRATGEVLLDAADDTALAQAVREAIEAGDETVTDLHLWRVGPGRHAAIVSLVAAQPLAPQEYKARLAHLPQVVHVSIEAHRCPEHPQ